jgi:holo-[acyl-carrier protein] synthase
MVLGIGLDIVSVGEVEDAVRMHGLRYLDRVYSEQEWRASCGDVAGLATRFAVKEATMKALGRREEPIPWRAITVQFTAAGHATIRLGAAAGELARRRGVRTLGVTISSFNGLAVAVVLAKGGS